VFVITKQVNSQFLLPDSHRIDKQHYRLRAEGAELRRGGKGNDNHEEHLRNFTTEALRLALSRVEGNAGTQRNQKVRKIKWNFLTQITRITQISKYYKKICVNLRNLRLIFKILQSYFVSFVILSRGLNFRFQRSHT